MNLPSMTRLSRASNSSTVFAIAFGFIGYLMRRLNLSVLPFVVAFILANNLETTLRQAVSASGADPFFFFKCLITMVFFA